MAAPLPASDMDRATILNTKPPQDALMFLAGDKEHRLMRAGNIVDYNYGSRPLAEKLLLEEENFMEMWHAALAYIDDPKDMGSFMSNKQLLDQLIPLMVTNSNFWCTPCGLSLWCCLKPESPLVIPCYYMQAFTVWVMCCPLAQCSAMCYRPCVGPLAPQTKLIDERKVAELAKIIKDAEDEATIDIKAHPEWEFNYAKKDLKYLHADEVIFAARLSIAAYMPTVEKGDKVFYSHFVPLVRERFIEKRISEGGAEDAVEAMNSFIEFFYSPSSPDPKVEDSRKAYGYGRPLKEVLEKMNVELVAGFDISATDTQGFIAKTPDFDSAGGDVIIAFRGTTSMKDWITNFSSKQAQFDPEKSGKTDAGMVHGGFYGAYNSILDIIKKSAIPLIEAGKPTRVIVTGHSLGGALATLAIAHLMACYESGLPLHVSQVVGVTFGNPKVGNQQFVDYVTKQIGDGSKFKAYRLHNGKDPVPRTPPAMLGFFHCFTRAVVVSNGQIYFPSDEAKKDQDVTTTALMQFASTGSALLGFHDIFVYAESTFKFRKICRDNGAA